MVEHGVETSQGGKWFYARRGVTDRAQGTCIVGKLLYMATGARHMPGALYCWGIIVPLVAKQAREPGVLRLAMIEL